jgi:hypothetical protein
VDGTVPGTAPGSAATIVAESRLQVGILFGFLSVIAIAALARGVTGAQTVAGRVAVVVIFGLLLVLFIARWIICLRHPTRLEITEDAIRFMTRNGQVTALSRAQGDELRFVRRLAGRTSKLGLKAEGGGPVLSPLNFFSRQAIRQAGRSRGWRFVN